MGQLEFVLKGRGFSRAANASKLVAALQFAEKLTIRIRVYLQAYRRCSVFSGAFRRCVGASEFFSNLFSRCGIVFFKPTR
jgi:hypothetical protein